MVWDAREENWQRGITAARSYREANGHLRVPARSRVDGFALGAWIAARRAERTRGDLSAERIAELDRLGMVWDAVGGQLAARTRRRSRIPGDPRSPARSNGTYVTDDGFRLGSWIIDRRMKRKRGDLSAKRICGTRQARHGVGSIRRGVAAWSRCRPRLPRGERTPPDSGSIPHRRWLRSRNLDCSTPPGTEKRRTSRGTVRGTRQARHGVGRRPTTAGSVESPPHAPTEKRTDTSACRSHSSASDGFTLGRWIAKNRQQAE